MSYILLFISSVTNEDEGEYFCMVTKPNALAGKVSTAIQLRVSKTGGLLG